MNQRKNRNWPNSSLFEIHLKNISKGPLFNSESTVITLPLKNEEVTDIYLALENKEEWIRIYGRAVLKVDEIKRVVRVYEDDV